MMFPQCFAPAGLCYVHAQCNFIEYNRFAADQSLGLYSPQENKIKKRNVNAAVSGCRTPKATGRRRNFGACMLRNLSPCFNQMNVSRDRVTRGCRAGAS